MIRVLPVVIQLALLVFCLIDCIQTDSFRVRNLPKTLWVVLIIFLPLIGSIAWLVAGRPEREAGRRGVPWPATQTAGFPEYERPRPAKGPDDDPEFLAQLRDSEAEHQRMLEQWEAKLRAREAELRASGTAALDPGTASTDAGATPAPEGTAEPTDEADGRPATP